MNVSNFKKQALDLFLKYTNFTNDDILDIKQIHCGFTNISFVIKLKNKKKYQVRIGQNNKIVNRDNEIKVLKLIPDIKFLYIDKKGNAIKEWIEGVNPNFDFNTLNKLKLLILEIKKIQNINIGNINILEHNYYDILSKDLYDKYKIWYDKYIEIIDKYKNLKKVFSHNDLNPKNMIYNRKNKKIILIDYEWARINNQYWDIANFFKETNLRVKYLKKICKIFDELDFNILKDFVFISSFYALAWTYQVNQTEKIFKYRKKILIKLKQYYRLFFDK